MGLLRTAIKWMAPVVSRVAVWSSLIYWGPAMVTSVGLVPVAATFAFVNFGGIEFLLLFL